MGGVIGINHITLAVSDVARSLAFYRDVLGFRARAVWQNGAYLDAGSLWLCLSHDECARTSPHPDYTHIAFTVADADYSVLSAYLTATCPIWKEDRSEGASTYFLDPDGHRLEIHHGSLQSRLRHYRESGSAGVTILDDGDVGLG